MRKSQTIKDHAKESKLFMQRSVIALLFAMTLLSILTVRLYYLQVFQHSRYAVLSDNNRVNVVPIGPNRGLIYDRHGKLLAENVPSFQLEIIPEQVSDLKNTIYQLSEIVDVSKEDIEFFHRQLRHKRRFEGVPIRFDLTEKELAAIAVNRYRLPGVDVVAGLIRHYPRNDAFAHVLGYVGRINERELKKIDNSNYSATKYIGKTGIEKYYEKSIHGQVGHQRIETDARGRIVRILERTPPTPGADLHLTIDAKLQEVAVNALQDKRGVAVVMDPRNGEILALVSNPSYDPNKFVVGIDNKSFQSLRMSKHRPLFNRAIKGQYPPGSTIKPILGLYAISKDIISANQKIFDPGWFQLEDDDHKYRDWKKLGHGWVNLKQAIAQSCSTFFYELANKTGITAIHKTFVAFGLGQATGIDITGEARGIVPSIKWKKQKYRQPWYPGETLITGIGQGFTLATPIQLIQMTAIIANRGHYVQPHLVQYLKEPNGTEVTPEVLKEKPQKQVTFAGETDWQTIIDAMRMTTQSVHGTAHVAFLRAPYSIASKTGTAQVSTIAQDEEYDEESLEQHLRDHSLFVAFAPINKPRVAVAIILENQKGSSYIARKILDQYFKMRKS